MITANVNPVISFMLRSPAAIWSANKAAGPVT
ncbi:Uncharacterised protein [Mycobacterium tuberculosis]|uniref:Uncharacterized protein n=1 Tax=Mycobacterium tuberculosis TaxID=1773 RepID=A0A916P9R9_MYCTX|nr:Uncharacterised protein [Mycobacterium tuberculosis]COW09679.1 Uncharacterised protein [Mycobacterium tuberculosis]COW79606.1 Uncharacterised protein [Mycobacterium tuberculosis]COX82602.1 Uncharacterised protein [Mycobacterium tuberculosis]